MIRSVKIAEDRIGVLIGPAGRTKREIEKKTKTKIIVGDEITINGDALDVMGAENIIKAIGRGFSPVNAFDLLDEENTLYIIILPKNPAELKRVRSRLIGQNGKCRRNIEMITKTKISIYGKTASIIGNYENVELAESGIKKLITGIPHKNVYAYLEERK
ncbi:MAG: KH domain-containing protein [Candidatus Aenigmarchaeota archaeon]|nr:KH domain-containing protein [Candidatus Aenigmarchaeota archaeon]